MPRRDEHTVRRGRAGQPVAVESRRALEPPQEAALGIGPGEIRRHVLRERRARRALPLAELGSAELAANCIEDALVADDISAERLGAFEPALWDGVETVRRLIHAFYDPDFSFTNFVERFPKQRRSLIDCLVGDVVKDMTPFREALETMTQPPPPLTESIPLPNTTLALADAI